MPPSGGSADLLEASARHWHGVVAQLTGLGMFRDEFEIGTDPVATVVTRGRSASTTSRR